jgi:group I intron endonuclease
MGISHLAIVYLIENSLNGKVYVGKTERGLLARWKQHIKAAEKGSSLLLHRAICKHGVENFTVNALCEVPVVGLNEAERMYITQYKSYPPNRGFGYNMSPGGDGGVEIGKISGSRPRSDRQKEQTRKLNELQRQPISDETRRLLSEWQRGDKNPRFGKNYVMPKSTKQKIAEAQLQVYRDPQMRLKQSTAQKKRVLSNEALLRICRYYQT